MIDSMTEIKIFQSLALLCLISISTTWLLEAGFSVQAYTLTKKHNLLQTKKRRVTPEAVPNFGIST